MTRLLYALCVVILFFQPLFAQELSTLYEDDILFGEEELIVISATKIEQKVSEAPATILVIAHDQIQDYDWQSLNDILYRQPGFAPCQDYDRRTVASRGVFEGWNNNHLLLLIDGLPYNDNLYGSAYTWEITPLFMVKSVEVIRGPGSALYGSNATNGVLTINTLSANDLNGSSRMRFRLGNEQTRSVEAVTGSVNHFANVVVGYQASRTAGNSYPSYDDFLNTMRFSDAAHPPRFQIKDDRHSSYFFVKAEGKDYLNGLSLQFHDQHWDFQTGHGWLWQIPDFEESMHESRQILSLQYCPVTTSRLEKEVAIRYQRHNIDWNMRYAVNGAYEFYYPAGMWEYLNTKADDIFARVQGKLTLPHRVNLLAGIETTYFLYTGDNEHYSNVDLADFDYPPYPNNEMQPQGPWFEWIVDKPIYYLGFFSQLTSGDLLGERLSATAGIRFDRQFFNFSAVDKPNRPEEDKSFSKVSPRLGIVYKLAARTTLKWLAGRAFRSPSPTELFGTNTWTLASNLRELDPEIITTFEFAADHRLTKHLNVRLNGFFTKFENQIAYSEANYNLSTNIYTLTTTGLELEAAYTSKNWSGFANYSLAQRIDESIIDELISESGNELTWFPAHLANIGLAYKRDRVSLSAQVHYQGEVLRRESDRAGETYRDYRPENIESWVTVDVFARYQVTPYLSLDLSLANLTDTDKNVLIKNFDYPFDYRQAGQRLRVGSQVQF